ncbi:exopolysaccharide biosynthesis polyprenyl glycosylphosphotransferase [Beijerinckia sp. L45]|uniref:exopolysaccharide biosynthesis polyprenyl glycosylphosphotransferase n=1 Tax=Beijerinckia sp. L45 TaxID=1641855 RepID=UPI00131D7AB9|nr:exopolysaccharide biosynthesis polyprenyl glycosylphosphotransferase [Beijerinckia sp. L45]
MTAALVDLAAITLSAGLVGYAYHELLYQTAGMTLFFAGTGFCLGIIFVITAILREDYDIRRYRTFSGHARRAFLIWNVTFVTALVLVFTTKTTDLFSRATMTLLYGTGFGTILAFRSFVVVGLKRNDRLDTATAQRIFLVGGEDEITRFTTQNDPWTAGVLVGASVLRGPTTMADDLALAAASARMLRPDDVFILLPWSQEEAIDGCVEAFKRVPAAVHLGLERALSRFGDVRFSRIGSFAGLNLVRQPLTRAEVAIKRLFDVLGALALLAALSPLFALVALAIKLESKGPVLFFQRRYGFNQEPFRIVKFRSMSTLEDGRDVRQAERGDRRITRVGRFMRRYNIDELPQLVNVLHGEMSLVGPRPHALAHDQQFETTIANYARRHNMKPGITGWAQVNGLRGPILTASMIQKRIEHDLYYVDNWSMSLDLRIIVQTAFSPKAFENAL